MGVIVVLIPLVVVPLVIVGRRVRGLSRASQDRVADTSGLADETLNAMQTVQAFTLEALQSERYRERRGGQLPRPRTAATACARCSPRSARCWCSPASRFVLWLGARAVLAGEMTSGELGQFLLYAGIVGASAAALTEMWGEVQRAAGAMERLVELLAAAPAIAAPDSPVHAAAAAAAAGSTSST